MARSVDWKGGGVIRQLDFMKCADNFSQDARHALMHNLAALRTSIDGMEDFRMDRNISPETHPAHGVVDMFWIDLRDVQARDASFVDETHKSIGSRIITSLDGGPAGIFVCDVEL